MQEDLTVFISYSWDSESHKEWVRRLADYLINPCGLNVILDQYDLAVGNDMTYFMETSIEKADKVLLILSPGYKAKSEARQAGAGFEYSIISANLFDTQTNNKKFLPILRSGSKKDSSPGYIKALVYHDMKNDGQFESNAFNLSRIIYEEAVIKKPVRSAKPDFDKVLVDPILELANNIAAKNELENKKKAYAYNEALNHIESQIPIFFKTIKDKAIKYKNETPLFFNSDYYEKEGRLIIEGHCLYIRFKIHLHRDFNATELRLELYDRLVLIGKEIKFYFPGEEPQMIWHYHFKPEITNDLQIIWCFKDLRFTLERITEFAFSTLLEWAATYKKNDTYL